MEETLERRYELRGINTIYLGFLLVLLNFRIAGFDLFPDFIGYILVFNGLSKISNYDRYFEKAKPFALFSMVLSVFDFYQVNYPIGEAPKGVITYGIIAGFLSLFVHLLLYYYLIYGIYWIAKRLQVSEIVYESMSIWKTLVVANIIGYFVMIFVFLSATAALPLTIFIIVFLLIAQIVFLSFLKKSYSLLDGQVVIEDFHSYSGNPVLRKVFSHPLCIPIVLCAIVITIVSVLYFQSSFKVQSTVYNQHDSTASESELNSIREKMMQMGFTESNISDMPDNEILYYKNCKSTRIGNISFESDGGNCIVRSYATSFSDQPGKVRLAILYQWITPPKTAYSDVIGVGFSSNLFALYSNENQMLTSYNLYDKQEENNEVITYNAKDVRCEFNNLQYFKKFRVYNKTTITNQRGYLAFNIRFSNYSEELEATIMKFYIHQSTFLTLNNAPEDRFKSGSYGYDQNYDFKSYIFPEIIENNS